MTVDLDAEDWGAILSQLDEPSVGAVAEAVAGARDVKIRRAYGAVERAIDRGPLLEEDSAGVFGTVRLAPESAEKAKTPETGERDTREGRSEADESGGRTVETPEDRVESWEEADFADPNSGECLPEHLALRQWMGHVEKKPFAPWGDANPDDADPDDSPRWEWGRTENYVDGETIAKAEVDPRLDGRVFLQQHDGPYAFVDGDDVRDPETGDVHPEFLEILERLGVTYADISISGAGVHAYYRGELPRGLPEAKWSIDDEPYGANDEPPAVEIYANKHVCVATGDRVGGTPLEAVEWDSNELEAVLDEWGQLPEESRSTDPDDYDLEDYEPKATGSDETTDDIRDVFRALDRLDPKRVGERTIVREWTRDRRGFLPVWGHSDDNGTANYIDDRIWHDTGHDGGYGGPVVMAAIDAGLIRHTGASPADVRGKTFFDAVDHLRDLGFTVPELEETTSDDAEPVAALPLERLDEMDLQEARRFASKRGVDWPTTRETREALRSDICETMRHGDTRLHDAPTGLGKSYAIASEPWLMRSDITGESPVIQLSETTKARDQAANDSEEAGVSYARLLGRTEACPVAGGEHDPVDDDGDPEDLQEPDTVVTIDGEPASEWLETMCNRRGLPLSVAHKYLDNHNDQDIDLPCCEGSECHSVSQWDDLPRNDDGDATVDVIHATHAFAHVPSIRNGTNLVFDERPNFIEDLSHGRIREAVTAYLSEAGAPVSTFEQMVTRALDGDDTPNEHAEHAYISQALDHDPGREWYLEADGAHTLAPALTRAIYYALLPGDDGDQQDANGRYSATVPHEPPRLDKDAKDSDGWNRTYVTVVMDDTLTVRYARNTPNLSGARSVVGLDAHPEVTLWQQNVHPDIRISPVLGPTRRALWKRYERGLLVVGVGDATRPLTSGEYFDEDGTRAFLRALREQFGERFSTTITARSVEDKTRRILEEVGVDDPETMHYGEEKSRGDFGDHDIGALNGCIDPGDGYVLDRLAEAGLDATPETIVDEDGNERRAHGRGFVGPDSEAADSLLESVRAQHTAQGAGRYARNADDPDDRAIVFVRTDAAPTGFIDIQVPGVEWLATEKQQTIVDALRENAQATARELAETTGLTKEHVRTTLQRLEADDVVSVREGAGAHGAHLYRALSGLESGDVVDLTPQTANDDVTDYYTWSLAISQPTAAGIVKMDDDPPRPEASPQASAGETGSEPPP